MSYDLHIYFQAPLKKILLDKLNKDKIRIYESQSNNPEEVTALELQDNQGEYYEVVKQEGGRYWVAIDSHKVPDELDNIYLNFLEPLKNEIDFIIEDPQLGAVYDKYGDKLGKLPPWLDQFDHDIYIEKA